MDFKKIWRNIKNFFKAVKTLWVITVFVAILLFAFVFSFWHPWIAIVNTGLFTGLLIYFLVLEYKEELSE